MEAAEKVATIVAAIATVAALYGILNQLKANRQDNARRALDLIVSILKSDSYVSDRQVFLEAKPEEIILNNDTTPTAKHDAVRRLLNAHEIIALYVNDNLVDEAVARKYLRGWFISDWQHLSTLIAAARARSDNQALYIQYEMLMERWTQPPRRGAI